MQIFPNCSFNISVRGLLAIALTLLSCTVFAVEFTMGTVAGNGTRGVSSDSVSATATNMDRPYGLYFHKGALYIADRHNNQIRKVDSSGLITTLAGDGSYGYSGNDGPATAAQFRNPYDMTVGDNGAIYISDTFNHVIRKITANGIITIIAGNTSLGLGYSGDGGAALDAQLDKPAGIVQDEAGNLYFAERGNHVIRKVSPDGIISTFAGTGTSGYDGDGGAAVAARLNSPANLAYHNGELYISDEKNHVVRKISAAGMISTVAGNGEEGNAGDGGPATQALLNSPNGLAFDTAGNLFIADTLNHVIRRVNRGGIITTVAGVGTQADVAGEAPQTDVTGEAPQTDNGPALLGQLAYPTGLTSDARGNIYVADRANDRVRKLHLSGGCDGLALYVAETDMVYLPVVDIIAFNDVIGGELSIVLQATPEDSNRFVVKNTARAYPEIPPVALADCRARYHDGVLNVPFIDAPALGAAFEVSMEFDASGQLGLQNATYLQASPSQ